MKRIHGKPFNYFKLGKSFHEGRPFMEHMKSSAELLVEEAVKKSELVAVKKCPVCGSGDIEPLATIHKFEHHQCRNSKCRHVFISKLVSEKLRSDFFSRDEGYSQKNYCDPKLSEFRIREIAIPKIDYALSCASSKANSWLDVGCGSGEILSVMKKRGWKTLGLELNVQDIEFGKKQFEVDIRRQTLEEFAAGTNEKFDVISFFGVIHCVPEPKALVECAAKLLSPGGILVAELSHHESLEAAAVQTFPHHPSRSCYNGTTTLQHFTADSASLMFESAGLKPESVWFYGTDIFEILNQWCFSSSNFAESPLYHEILKMANELQAVIDKSEKSSGMLWVAKK
jgi:2-polyprenyl-3-methyl-5-hydroxy-6-metoxy-1,4-benzoquinol methylase